MQEQIQRNCTPMIELCFCTSGLLHWSSYYNIRDFYVRLGLLVKNRGLIIMWERIDSISHTAKEKGVAHLQNVVNKTTFQDGLEPCYTKYGPWTNSFQSQPSLLSQISEG